MIKHLPADSKLISKLPCHQPPILGHLQEMLGIVASVWDPKFKHYTTNGQATVVII